MSLSEAADLSDVFLFRLMFRLVPVPSTKAAQQHFAHFAARLLPLSVAGSSRCYLVVSALSIDHGGGICSARTDNLCSIYDRRPHACRSVPFHYTIEDSRLTEALDSFVSTPAFHCDTGPSTPIVLVDGKLIASEYADARAKALVNATMDRRWAKAIANAVHPTHSADLPSLSDIVANFDQGALTTSMRIAWDIAVAHGLMEPSQRDRAIDAQLDVMDRILGSIGISPDDRATVADMRREYAMLACSAQTGPMIR